MRGAGRRLGVGLALGVAASCSSPPPSAWLQVELLSGGPPPPVLAPGVEERLQVILDLSSSMERELVLGGEPSPLEAARAATVELLQSLPSSTEVGLQVIGVARGTECPPPVWFSTPAREHTPAQLASGVAPLSSRSEGSLREALARARREIERSEPTSSWRVAVFSDLGAQCDGDPCAEIQELVDLGAQVDLVLLGAEPAACLEEIEIPEDVALGEALAPAPPPAFRLETLPAEETGETLVWARGRAMQEPIPVPPGRAVVVLELEPPFRIGPVDLSRGVLTLVRGVDFPAAQPSWRAWSVARRSAAGLPGGAP